MDLAECDGPAVLLQMSLELVLIRVCCICIYHFLVLHLVSHLLVVLGLLSMKVAKWQGSDVSNIARHSTEYYFRAYRIVGAPRSSRSPIISSNITLALIMFFGKCLAPNRIPSPQFCPTRIAILVSCQFRISLVW